MQITRPDLDRSELELVQRCFESGWVTQGPRVAEFEALIAKRHSLKHALATTSCTAALHMAALALHLEPGAEVVVPSFTWVTSAHAAEFVGARAVFADIDLATYNLDPAAFEAALTPRTRAVVPVHLFGLAAEMDEILAIARRHRLAVIEDAACAIGTSYRGCPVGALGDVGCFSFHPRKVITTGEGGMLTTNRDDLARKVCSLRNHGASPPVGGQAVAGKPHSMASFEVLGFNLRMSDIQAAVGIGQMAKLERLLRERRLRAKTYASLLADIDEFVLPAHPDNAPGHTYQSYVIRLRTGGRERRNTIMEFLAARGIQTRPGTHAVHRLGYYAEKYGLRPEDFPNAASAEDTTITLPLFPNMSEVDQERVAAALRESLLGGRA